MGLQLKPIRWLILLCAFQYHMPVSSTQQALPEVTKGDLGLVAVRAEVTQHHLLKAGVGNVAQQITNLLVA